MKIAILGTNGFLSTAIGRYYQDKDCSLDMYGLDAPEHHRYTHFCKIDLLADDLDLAAITGADIIVYAIGAGIQSNLKEGADLIYRLNVTCPVNICNKLKALNYQGVFVTFGSVFEMGEVREERKFTEEDILTSTAPAPTDYVVSKRMLSRFVSSYKHDFTHWHFIIPTIYGAGENPKRLIPYTINAIQNNEELHFTAGDQTRQYVHVSEVPRLLELAYQKGLRSGVYNIEGKDILTVREIVTLIHAHFDKSVPADCFGTASRTDVGMKYLALDGNRLLQDIGFEAQMSIDDAIQSYIRL